MVLKDRLVGTLRLVSLETRRSDGTVAHPFGPKPAGIFMFDADGNFAVQLTDPRGEAGAGTHGALWGTYDVDEEQQCFTLWPEGSTDPSIVGTSTVRHVRFQDDLFVFNTTPAVVDGVETVTYITWRPSSPR
jgi:hypothetical protein